MALSALVSVPMRVATGAPADIMATVTNAGPATASGEVVVNGVSNRGEAYGPFPGAFTNLLANQSLTFTYSWVAPTLPGNVRWTATVTAEGDVNPANDTATLKTQISP